MKIKARFLDCPSCGAPVDAFDREIGTCSHCGRTFAIYETAASAGRHQPPGARSPTIGSVVWRRLRPHLGAVLSLVAVVATALAAILILNFYRFTKQSAFGDDSILASVFLGGAALLLSAVSHKRVAIALLLLGGAALISKPLFYPMLSDMGPEVRTFSLTSETHLNFLIPGALLLALALVLTLSLRIVARREGHRN